MAQISINDLNTPAGGAPMEEYRENKNRHTLRRLLKNFLDYKLQMAYSLMAAVATNLIDILRPILISYMIDDFLELGIFRQDIFVYLGLGYIMLSLMAAFTTYAGAYYMTYVGQRIMHKLRTELFDHIQHLSIPFFDRNSSGRILTRITSDVEALSELFSHVVINFLKDFIKIIGLIIAMFVLDAKLACYSMFVIPVIALITYFYRKAVRGNFIKLKSQLSRLNGFIAENVTGMRIVQIFDRTKNKFDEFSEMNVKYYHLGLREIILNSFGAPLLNSISNVAIALMIAFFAGDVRLGLVSAGTIYAFTTYIRQFLQPISEIAEQLSSIQSAFVSADRVYDIMDTNDTLEDLERGKELSNVIGKVEFKNVWFAYIDENWVLKDVSFVIEPGKKTAFVGATGSGKSTIINLIGRFYEIQQGEILIDGVDIREYNLVSLRRAVAVVMQDVFLFSGDLAYNIRLNESSITDEQIMEAAHSVMADEFVNGLPGKLKYQVNEQGSSFSSGQRQLVSFARAVAFNPAILVLDEATASVDTLTELAIGKMLETMRKRTVIVVAHRLSTIIDSDQIIVINRGHIAEVGNHETLMSLGGMYQKLYTASIKSETNAYEVKNA